MISPASFNYASEILEEILEKDIEGLDEKWCATAFTYMVESCEEFLTNN